MKLLLNLVKFISKFNSIQIDTTFSIKIQKGFSIKIQKGTDAHTRQPLHMSIARIDIIRIKFL